MWAEGRRVELPHTHMHMRTTVQHTVILHSITIWAATQVFVKFGGIANSPVKFAFREAGLRPTKGRKWNVCWGPLGASELAKLHEFQRVCHFPGEGHEIGGWGQREASSHFPVALRSPPVASILLPR